MTRIARIVKGGPSSQSATCKASRRRTLLEPQIGPSMFNRLLAFLIVLASPCDDRAMRVVIGEDQALLRQGIVRLLEDAGFEVVAQAADAPDLLRKVAAHKPDVAIVDVQMPPDNTDDGLRAALEIRARQPEVGVLVLSQYAEERYALDLIGDNAEGVGYLLKDRVADFAASPRRCAAWPRAARRSTRRRRAHARGAAAATTRSTR